MKSEKHSLVMRISRSLSEGLRIFLTPYPLHCFLLPLRAVVLHSSLFLVELVCSRFIQMYRRSTRVKVALILLSKQLFVTSAYILMLG